MTVYLLNPYRLGWQEETKALFGGPMTLCWRRSAHGIYIEPFFGYKAPNYIVPSSWR